MGERGVFGYGVGSWVEVGFCGGEWDDGDDVVSLGLLGENSFGLGRSEGVGYGYG